MKMNMGGSNPTWYWVFWWIFTLLVYAGLVIWWKREIKKVDKMNSEKYELLKKYREEQSSKSNYEN